MLTILRVPVQKFTEKFYKSLRDDCCPDALLVASLVQATQLFVLSPHWPLAIPALLAILKKSSSSVKTEEMTRYDHFLRSLPWWSFPLAALSLALMSDMDYLSGSGWKHAGVTALVSWLWGSVQALSVTFADGFSARTRRAWCRFSNICMIIAWYSCCVFRECVSLVLNMIFIFKVLFTVFQPVLLVIAAVFVCLAISWMGGEAIDRGVSAVEKAAPQMKNHNLYKRACRAFDWYCIICCVVLPVVGAFLMYTMFLPMVVKSAQDVPETLTKTVWFHGQDVEQYMGSCSSLKPTTCTTSP